MSLSDYLAKKVCDLVSKSAPPGSFGPGIFEYDSHNGNYVKIWGGVHIVFLEEGKLVKIVTDEQDMKEKVVQRLRDKYHGDLPLEKEDALFLEYVRPNGGEKTILEAGLTHEISKKEEERFFSSFYKSAIKPALGELFFLKK